MFSVDHLNALRAAEISTIEPFFQAGSRILEIGAGTGQQALELSRRGYDVTAIEVAHSNYATNRVYDVVDYDGIHIPFPDRSFDIVFSSNVLEHVPDLEGMLTEIRRVLQPQGYCVHILPTHAWRFWTTLSAFPTAWQQIATLGPQLLPPRWPSLARLGRLAICHAAVPFFQRRHGERGNIISELWQFSPWWWRRQFGRNGYEVLWDEPMGLFYTGNMVFGSSWNLVRRRKLSRILGSACHMFKVQPTPASRVAS